MPEPGEEMFGRTLFSVDGTAYLSDDLVLSAILSGEWETLLRQTSAALDADAQLTDPLDPELEATVDEAAAQFRYARDLITARDTERWLADRGLTVDEWQDHIRRSVLAAGQLPAGAPEPDPVALQRAVWVDLVCGGVGAALTDQLAQQAAIDAAGAAEPPAETDPAAFTGQIAEILAQFPELDPAATTARVRRLVRISSAIERYRQAVITPDVVRREIEHRALDWMRVDCRMLAFDDERLAREAALCLREDGLQFDEVAREAHGTVSDARLFVEELDGGARTVFLSARPVDLLGPLVMDGRHVLVRVLDKVRADPADPDIRAKAEAALLDRLLGELVEHRVVWELRW